MAIKKVQFSDVKKKFSKETAYKPDRFFDLGDVFLEVTGLPGPVMGHINMFLGHTDTGKTTALLKTAADAQKKGILPVFIITEQKWSWEHSKILGLETEQTIDKDTGEITHDGFFIFNSDFQWIEQITDYINEMLDAQDKGEIPYDLLFLWDSIGSVPCKMTFDGKGGKQHNASVLADKIGMGINQRITGSRKKGKTYTNTLIIVNQPWVELPDNPFGRPKIKAKGGESVWLNSTLVFLFGNEKNSGITKLGLTKDGRKTKIGIRTKISVIKNHVNGLGYEDGKILATAHGFMAGRTEAEEKQSKAEYIKFASDYIRTNLRFDIGDGDFEFTDSTEEEE
jgi:hypothetical protein